MQELFKQAISTNHPQCGVPGIRDISRGVDNAVQHRRQRQLLNDSTVSGQQPLLSRHNQRCLFHKLAHQQLNREPLLSVRIPRKSRSRLDVPALDAISQAG
jgi:hypothetical protein